jgi:hypothetical protein
MKFKNTLHFPDHFLRRMLSWVCKHEGYLVRDLREVIFRKAHRSFSGTAYHYGKIVSVPSLETVEFNGI